MPDFYDFFDAQVLDIKCRLRSEDLFGRVCDGHLTTSSPTLRVAVRSSEAEGRELILDMEYKLIMDINSPKGYSELPADGFVICIFLEGLRHHATSAIVLEPCMSGSGGFSELEDSLGPRSRNCRN
jgi:hypothetical protein